MKSIYTNTLLFLLCLAGFSAAAQTEYGDGSLRVTGYRYNSWNDVSSTWQNGDSIKYSYNAQGKEVMRVAFDGSSAWSPSYVGLKAYDLNGNMVLSVDSYLTPFNYNYRMRETMVYNSSNQVEIRTQSRWFTAGGVWRYSTRNQISYTATGKTNIRLSEKFRTGSNTWRNDTRVTYSYNGSDLASSYLYERWDTVSNIWGNLTRGTYTYDGNGNKTMEAFETWAGGAWQNSARNTFTYDGQGRVLTETKEIWNAGAWQNSKLITYTYGNLSIITSYLEKVWNSGVANWVNNVRNTVTIGSNGYPENQLNQTWDDVSSTWKNTYQYEYTYNTHGYLEFTHIETWNTTLLAWANIEESFYWYETNPLAGINDLKNNLSLMVFPNPTTDIVTVHLNEPATQPVSAELLDATGRVVAQLGTQMPDGQQNFAYNLSGVARGLYYLSVKAGNSTGSMPLVIE